MQTITRIGIESRETATPRYDKRWTRAMSALNIAHDQRYMAEAVEHERRASSNRETAEQIAESMEDHHAAVAALVEASTDTTHLPPVEPPIVLMFASPNSPNLRPVAHYSAEGAAA